MRARAVLRWTRGLRMTYTDDDFADAERAEIAIDQLRELELLPEGSSARDRGALQSYLARTIALLEAFGFEGARRELKKEAKT